MSLQESNSYYGHARREPVDHANTVKQTAAILVCSVRTVWNEVKRGKLKAKRFSRNRTRFMDSEIARYCAEECE